MWLQHIRRVVEHLRSRGYQEPLRELTFATFGPEIYFRHADGTWEGDLRPDQIVLEKILRLDPLRAPIAEAAERQADAAGQGLTKGGVRASAPAFAGTRIRVTESNESLRDADATAASH